MAKSFRPTLILWWQLILWVATLLSSPTLKSSFQNALRLQRAPRSRIHIHTFRSAQVLEIALVSQAKLHDYEVTNLHNTSFSGQKFAMLEMKSMVSKVIRHYKLSLPRDKVRKPVLVAELILRPENGIWLEIEPRV
jgi:hypothetical protein